MKSLFYLFIYLFKNSAQYKQYKIEDTIKLLSSKVNKNFEFY